MTSVSPLCAGNRCPHIQEGAGGLICCPPPFIRDQLNAVRGGGEPGDETQHGGVNWTRSNGPGQGCYNNK